MISKKQSRKRKVAPPPVNPKKVKINEDLEEGEEEETGEDFGGGFQIEPFNLKQERESGFFEDGFYVEKDDDEQHDPWLDQYDPEEIKKFSSQLKGRNRTRFDLDDKSEPIDSIALKQTIVSILKEDETVTAALKRLGRKNSKKEENEANAEEFKKKFNELTEAAHTLLSSGYYNVYSDSREKIQQTINKEMNKNKKLDKIFEGTNNYGLRNQNEKNDQRKDTPKVDDGILWEYKGVDGTVYGPYKTQEMRDWWAQGYFQGENIVDVRSIKQDSIFDEEEEKSWVRSDTMAHIFG